MTKLSDDVRHAFDKEQAALGDLSDAPHRLVQNALASRDHPPSRGPHWAAGIAAVLIAAVVIATLVLVRAGSHSHPLPAATPSPKAVVSPTPLSNQIAVPATTPLILYHDPTSFDQLDAMTWDGSIIGRVGYGVASGGLGSPGGAMYTTMGDIRDRQGQVVGAYDSKNESLTWADDDQHFCKMARTGSRDSSGPGMLQIGAQGQPVRSVTQVGSFPPASSNGGGPRVVSCSPGADRAVVDQSGGQGVGVTQFWVVQLSTGRTLWTGGSGSWIAASHDGKFIALADDSGKATVYGPSGAVLTRLADTVFGFSWDGTLAITAPNFSAAPRIVRWADGTTIWSSPGSSTYTYWDAFAEPNGSHIAVGVLDPANPQTGGFAPVDLFVVGADGSVTLQKKDLVLLSQ